MNIRWITWPLNAAILLLLLVGLWSAIQAYRGRLSWGQARFLGMTATLFAWTQCIFFLAVADIFVNIFGFVFDWPLWVVLVPTGLLLVLVIVIYVKLLHRETFKPVMFGTLVLVPLGIPPWAIMGRMAKKGAVTVTTKCGIQFAERSAGEASHLEVAGQTVERLADAGSSRLGRELEVAVPKAVAPEGKLVKTCVGDVVFKNSQHIGSVGEQAVHKLMTGRGYQKLKSKLDSIHGIDGIYFKPGANGKSSELFVSEVKTNGGKLQGDQLTNEWIRRICSKMMESADNEVSAAGRMLLDAINNTPEIVKRFHWNVDLATGRIAGQEFDEAGKLIRSWDRADSLVKNILEGRLRSGNLQRAGQSR